MNKPNQISRFLALASAVLLMCASPAVAAQAPAASPNQDQATPLITPATTPAAQQPQQPVVPLTPLQEGDLRLAQKRYQAAIAAYNKIPKKSAAVWNKMGIAYQLMLNFYEAEHCYRESLRLDKKNATVLNNLATVYDSQKNYKQAERMYRKALKINPKSPLILKNLGTVLINQNKFKKGWKAYEAAIAIDPTIFASSSNYQISNPTSVEQRGAMNYFMARGCARAGLREQAIDYLRKAINEGYTTPKKVVKDAEFANLIGFPPFEQMLAEQEQRP